MEAERERRLSRRISGIVVAAAKAVSKLTEGQKDPEEDPDFVARNPQWEPELPPIHGVRRPTDAKAQSTAALLAALDELPPIAIDSAAKQNWKKAYKTVKRILIVRRKAMRSALGTGAQMEGHALGVWSPYSTARLKLFMMLYNQKAEYVVLCLIISHLLVLIFQGSSQEQWTHVRKFDLDFADATLTLFYTIEMILRILCLGFIRGPNTYLRDPYNRLDFVIVIDSWVHIGVRSVTGSEFFARIAILRAFRALLVLKHFTFFADVIAIMSAVGRSIVPLENVIYLTLFIIVFYALLGIEFLEETLDQRCIRTTDNQLAYPERFCDAKKVTDGYKCPSSQSQKCLVSGNPNWGSTNFDQFHYALLTMFQVISLEGWSLLMYSIKDAEAAQADAYFMTLVVFGTYLLINVFIAGISGVFLRVRAEHQMLLKKSRQPNQVTFYNATVMANVLKDDIIKDDERNKRWHIRFINRSKKMHRDVIRAVSRTRSSVKAAFQATSFRFSRQFSMAGGSRRFSRTYSRALSRSVTMGMRAAMDLSHKSRAIVENPNFNRGVLLAVTINIIILCLYKYGMSNDLLYTLYAIQAVLLVIFATEMVLRFLAYGPGPFIADKMNVFDVFVISVSAGALVSRAYPNISSVRVLRWFYLSKKYVDKHPSTVATCIKSVGSLVSVFFFYLLVITICSIISMELYSGQYYNFPDGYPRGNHDSMLQTMLLWFTVTTGESWVNQMWNSMRPGVKYNWLAPFLYVLYYCMTTYVILNLIIAVILERSELTDNQKKQIQRVEHMKLLRRMHSRAYIRSGSWVVDAVEGAQAGFKKVASRVLSMNVRALKDGSRRDERERRRTRDGGSERASSGQSELPGAVSEQPPGNTSVTLQPSTSAAAEQSRTSSEATSEKLHRRSSQVIQTSGFPTDIGERRESRTALESAVLTLATMTKPPVVRAPSRMDRRLSRKMSRTASKRQSFQLAEYEELEKSIATLERPWYLQEGSLLLFGQGNAVRNLCQLVVGSVWWWWFSMFWAVISVWTVVEMKPNGDPLVLKSFLPVLHNLVFVVFFAELLMRVISQGLIFTPDAYMGEFYNLIDVFILIIDALNMKTTWSENSARPIHALLALRPFRFVCRLTGLKSLFGNLVSTCPAIASVLLFTFTIFAIFGSIAIQLFRGHLYSCNDTNVSHRAYCTGYYINKVSLMAPRAWTNPAFHFDDIGNALLTLFITSSFDNWVGNWLYPVMDIAPENHQPRRNHSPVYALFMVAFVCAGGFFIMRVFVGVFINEFGVRSGSKLLTERQKLWRDMNRIIQKMRQRPVPRPQKDPIRKFCYHLVHHKYYPHGMVIVILSYCAFLASHVANQTKATSRSRQKLHCFYTTLFLVEMLLKIIGNEFSVYKHDHASHLEAALSLTAAACLLPKKGSPRQTIGRVAYSLRLFCLIPHIPRARVLINTIIVCFPSMAEIMALLMICLFAFSGIGFQMFSQVKDGVCIGPAINFRSFVNSFITVFQVTTADNWSCIMGDVMVAPPYCTKGSSLMANDCGFPVAGVVYFVALIVVANNIFMNLFVAIILDVITFGLVNENSMITPNHLEDYRVLWSKDAFDPRGTGFIGIHKLRNFVNSLGIPLGRRHNASSEWYARIEYEVMSFRVPNKGIPFKQLLETLTLYKIGPTGLPLSLRIEREKHIQGIYRGGAVIKIQAAWRGHLVRRVKLRKKEEETEKETERTREKGRQEEIEKEEKLKSESILLEDLET
ncbi:voltage-dependent L-type calcium channel subunit alpha-1C isoform X1 [Selaginella moellendorffii]|uniref:voltage-dependent L-type calcium channel subunit alpha-1C isoform X1 n=2 Tax=Selaginella moellendorffii TaxID=88036 RepID=UPI000D1CDE38|nr:voltage-dependent L-type calcium channel subunit alpha-1C isoform X1 [Selaginella moellendorffii]|eukprot:XP_024521493.1 voltage-dependent L-type calcium channel subunit alpha-1C isoform X1 [Selaginella moellendorffii]